MKRRSALIGSCAVLTCGAVFLAAGCGTYRAAQPLDRQEPAGETRVLLAAGDGGLAAAGAPGTATIAQPVPRKPRVKKIAGERPDHPGEALEFRYRERLSENGRIPPDAVMRARDDVQRSQVGAVRNAGIDNLSWTELGPGNIGGRTRSILIHPTDPSTLWLGSVGGGIWKTTDAGASWQFLNDFLPALPVGCMAMHPFNPDVLFAGTGEGYGNSDSLPGAGILKSVDGGTTWAQIPSTIPTDPDPTVDPWGYVNRIAISPVDPQVMLAATKTAIFRTTDAGATWTQVFASRTNDVRFHPTDGTRAVAGTNTGTVIYSTNGGATWQTATGITAGGGRVEVTYARGTPSTVFASVNRSSGEIWRSTNGGQSFTLRNSGTNYLGGQGWYDNTIWVDPTNPDVVVVGGIDLWRSSNGGSSLSRISQWASAPQSAHADHHVIVEHPGFNGTSNRTVYFGNDGGIYRTDNVYSVVGTSGWIALNNNLGITQFYGGAVNHATGVLIGGTQDNGTLRTAGSLNWTFMYGGDGGWCASDQTNPNYFYGEYVYLRLHRSTNAGLSASSIYAGGANPLTDAINGTANFISPFILDPNESNRLLGGAANLWRSNNVKNSTPSWFIIKSAIGSNVSAIAVAAGNSDLIWVGHNNGNVYKTTNGTAASPTWTRLDNNGPGLPNRVCKRIAIDPANHDRVYASFSGYEADNMWRTDDGGLTWLQITGPGLPGQPNTLPRAPVDTIVLHPALQGWVYVGTDIGVFASTDYGATWSSSNDGPANVAVDELIFRGADTLIAITHGRGMFSATIDPAGVDCNGNNVEDITELEGNDCNDNQLLDECELAANPTLDCNGNSALDECDLAADPDLDCNGNSVIDACELASHPERDCNNNGIIDTCEPGGTDCNLNGLVDLCELDGDPGLDCDGNGVIDSCDMAAGAIAADDCPAATRAVPGTVYTGTTVDATNDGADTCNNVGATPPDRWFRYDPAANGSATISLCGSTYDSMMSVHSGCPGDSGNQIECDDDFCGGGSGSQVTIDVTAGASYWIRIAGWSASAGYFELRITGPNAYGDNDCNANGLIDACEPAETGPAITQDPQDAAACANQPVTFNVTAIGMAPLTYQWRKGGEDILGATAASYGIVAAGPADAGEYDVVVSNSCRTVTSAAASLSVFAGGSGDINLDGDVNGLDIAPLVDFLINDGAPGPAFCAADVNGDGDVTDADVGPFVNLLLP